jgi:phosphotransferase system enzyme I (PtsI)
MILRRKEEKLSYGNPGSINDEIAKVDYCISKATEELKEMHLSAADDAEDPAAQIINRYINTINSSQLVEDIKEKVRRDRVTAEFAITCIMEEFRRMVANLDDEYLYDRSEDIEEIKRRLLDKLVRRDRLDCSSIGEECILVAEDLTSGDVLNMNKKYVKGIVTIFGGPSSSSAVMARHMNIPAVTGAGHEGFHIKNGDLLIVDGNEGKVIVNPDDYELNLYLPGGY